MRTLFEAATGFPTYLFTVALVVVMGFWLLVAVGAADSGSFDGDVDADALGWGGVPVAVAFSLVTGFAWCGSLCATVLLDPVASSGPVRALTALAVLIAAPLLAWSVTRVLVRRLHRLFPDEPGPSPHDLVGLTCTIRTVRVDEGVGRAEVMTGDGSTVLVQVRQSGTDDLTSGSTGLLRAYEQAGDFFWASRFDEFPARRHQAA